MRGGNQAAPDALQFCLQAVSVLKDQCCLLVFQLYMVVALLTQDH